MRRAIIRRFGTPADVVDIEEVDLPEPRPGEIRVRMIARPIDPTDLLLASGRHIVRPALPVPIGMEGAGVVTALGEGVATPAVGRRVAVPFGGTWADEIVVRAADVVTLPDVGELDMAQASMLCVNPVTASLLVEGLAAGDWFVHNAAGSAVGRLITRMAARQGLRSVAVVRSDRHVNDLQELGAHVVLLDGEDLPERVHAATGGASIRRALDAVAGQASHRMFRCLADGGELLCYGLLSSDEVRLPATDLIFRDVTVRGLSRLRMLRAMDEDKLTAMWGELFEMSARGELDVPIEATYPLVRLRDALLHAERRDRTGKIIILDP
jgi:mitochondrial enoyl-[acyl-carrier protein] reductase / trans-2-enoyl-CoA reductase